ncbi:winged helix-turn-helix transcriptional regulator [Kineosporiaceae bacterium SCSIO 59966]|nr:winged helix-turn-helix transcriptional regulator [Kineosporiaceae bacterium SCSIO 59966]
MLVSAAVDVSRLARALADPMRVRILDLLTEEQLCTCHLQEILQAGQTLVSHHLRVLREAGVVQAHPHGRYTYYGLTPDGLDALADLVGRLSSAAAEEPPRRAC